MTEVIHDPATDLCACLPHGDEVCDYRLLADAVIDALNPRDGEKAEVYLCTEAVRNIAAYVGSLPCTCKPGYDDEPCGRCAALGQWHAKPRE